MFQIHLPHQKQLVSERQKIFKFMFFKLLLTRQKFFKFNFVVNLFLSNLFSYFGRIFFRFLFFNLFLQQTSFVLFLYLHILCKNMSFQTRILIRYVYEWSKFFSEIISDLFSYYLNVSLRWASCFISQPFFRKHTAQSRAKLSWTQRQR